MDYIGIFRELLLVARRSVGKPRADCDYKVSLVRSHRRGVMPVHTLHTEETRVVGRNCGKTHKRAADNRVELVRELRYEPVGF